MSRDNIGSACVMYSLQSIEITRSYDVLTLDSDSRGILLLLHKDRQEFMRGFVGLHRG